MRRAFIVRPFFTKAGVDFERVQSELIDPVLNGLGITGREVTEIVAAGNIRTDMFERLLVADLVIADISIHNANVFYELGIRHALRDRTTVLIRARVDDVPFDLRTDRYLDYPPDDPARARPTLQAVVEQSQATPRTDSPVFTLLPALVPVDPESVKIVPSDFAEEVVLARRDADLPRLAVLGEEAEGFDWTVPGLRMIGDAQFELKAWPDARRTWEFIRGALPGDTRANLALATIYQRLGRLNDSSTAIQRLLGNATFDGRERAEALSLKASNTKTLWSAEWHAVDDPAAAALRSPLLRRARETYDEAFLTDQNHWYPGVNALALTRVTLLLAARLPDVWAESFDDDEAAERALATLETDREELAAAVRRSLAAETARRTRRNEEPDVWLELTGADLAFLTYDRPARVRTAYASAFARADVASGGFAAESAARQIRLYQDLGLFEATAAAALVGLGVHDEPPSPPDLPRPRVIVFAGHLVDDPDRAQPRFPRTPEAEQEAARMIADAIAAEQQLAEGAVEGLAGGASGGDILFHEACAIAKVPTTLMLALPRDEFAAASVNDAGAQWTERYRRLAERLEVQVLGGDPELPGWLRAKRDYNLWARNNRWILQTALTRVDSETTLIVLWDGRGGDGPGGTADMVTLAGRRGARVVRLDASRLLASTAEAT